MKFIETCGSESVNNRKCTYVCKSPQRELIDVIMIIIQQALFSPNQLYALIILIYPQLIFL